MSEWEKELRAFGHTSMSDETAHYGSVPEIIRSGVAYDSSLMTDHTPLHYLLDETQWERLIQELAYCPLVLEGMWYDGQVLHALFLDQASAPLIAALRIVDGRYYGLSSVRKEAVFYERMISDLWGIEALSPVESFSLVDHNKWERMAPCNMRLPAIAPKSGMENVLTQDMKTHLASPVVELLSTGPADGSFYEAFALHMAADNVSVKAAMFTFGYSHRGIIDRFKDQTVKKGAQFSSRVNACASVAHQWAFSLAIEQITRREASKNISLLRCLFLELERIATHLYVLSNVFEKLDAPLLGTVCEKALEVLRELNEHLTGHRFLMDSVFSEDMQAIDTVTIRQKVGTVLHVLADYNDQLYALYVDATGLRKFLMGKGVLSYPLTMEMNIGGSIGRASGRDYDLRRFMPGYDLKWLSALSFSQGCTEARVRMRLAEITASLRIIHAALERFEPVAHLYTASSEGELYHSDAEQEGWGQAESAEGVVGYWVKIQEGIIKDIFYTDPSQKLSLLAEGLLKGENWVDVPVIVASLGLSAAGIDG